ncbi:MAG: RidA family protein [Planctomycetota bacterium]|nr:RidA family protein [Planctomycetota bacterium]
MRKIVATENAPEAVGPYSQAIIAGNLVFTAGQIPLDPDTGELVEGHVSQQARQALKNLMAVLEAAGSDAASVVKVTVFLKSIDDFMALNSVYEEFFSKSLPARSAVEVARLPKDALVEIEAVATLN